MSWDFPGGPVVKTSPSSAGGVGSLPRGGARIPQVCQLKRKKTNINNTGDGKKLNKDLKRMKAKKRKTIQDFAGGPVAKTLPFPYQGARVPFLVGELRPHMPQGTAKK